MKRLQKPFLGAALIAALAVGGALGPSLFSAGAATPATTATTTPSTSGTFTSNEDATHENAESAAREAAENNGTATFGRDGDHGSNEDATHEAGESAAREAAEDNGTASFGHDESRGSNDDATHEAGESAARGCRGRPEKLHHALDDAVDRPVDGRDVRPPRPRRRSAQVSSKLARGGVLPVLRRAPGRHEAAALGAAASLFRPLVRQRGGARRPHRRARPVPGGCLPADAGARRPRGWRRAGRGRRAGSRPRPS